MAVKEYKVTAGDKLKISSLVYDALKKNVQSLLFMVFSLTTLVFACVVTWCAFQISTQNKLITEQNDAIALQQVYIDSVRIEIERLKK